MIENIRKIIKEYLIIFPNESERLNQLKHYINSSTENEIVDWNNANGHITAGAFIYSLKNKKFLVLNHKDLEMYLYAGGHSMIDDGSPLITAKREAIEETGLNNLSLISISNDEMVPIDIDIHLIPASLKYNMTKHYHFDFRYLFTVNDDKIHIDDEEFNDYKWIDMSELENDVNYGNISNKLKKYLKSKK